MAKDLRLTTELHRQRPFLAGVSIDANLPQAQELASLLGALNAHKTSMDHDGRYYPRATMDGLLSAKTDKTTQILAGNGLMGGGSLHGDVGLFVGQGFGLSVDADTVGIDQSVNFDWTGEHSFGQNMRTKSILPILSDTYDLGAYNLPFRKIWGSELSAVIFSQYEQVLLGGWLTISKGEGKLPYMIDSGENAFSLGPGAFADGDILVFRGVDVDNRPQVEYMRVNNYISDDIYSVTRDLDGTGGNDWPDGTVFANWGQAGSGRIELNAQDTPRMSLYKHGANIADFAEILRIGDLNGNWGYSAPKYGMAIGAYLSGKANITQDEDGVLRIRNYNTDVIRLTGTLASFENWIQLGPTGGIRQGSGTWGTDFTGVALWNVNGIGRIAGLNAGVMQAWFGSDGKFYAGAGSHILDTDGFSIHETGNTYLYKYYNMDGALISTDSVDTLSYQFQRKIRVIGGSGKYPNVLFQAVNGSATSGLEVGATTFGYARYSGAQFEFLSKVIIGDPVNYPFNLEVGGSIFLKGYNVGEWQTWSPVLSAGSGTITNANVVAKYMVIGKTVFIKAIVAITTNGTAGAFVKLTLPLPALAQVRDFISGEAIVSALGTYSFSLGCSILPNTDLRIYSYDGTYPGADGRSLIVSGAYEIA